MTAAALPEAPPTPSRLPLPDMPSLVAALERALALVNDAGTRGLGLAELAAIDLPDTTPASADDQAHIRSIASLYLAAQLEDAHLLPAVELLAGLAVSGGLPADLGPAAPLIAAFWRGRSERFHESERRAFFARLFGAEEPDTGADLHGERAPHSAVFELLMIDLCESLYKLDDAAIGGGSTSPLAQSRVRTTARSLVASLLAKSGGMTAFAARDILATVQSAVHILQQATVQRAFGSQSLWGAVRAVSSRYLHVDADIQAHVTRGKAGLTVLAWLADALPALDDAGPLLTLDHPVIAAATDWLQASLAIREAGSRARG
jgi:hypothetical protein